ncbi:SPOR domain-containing protein [Sansalvadorimonas verongulae]|uniref:SPOR domain-containing protein n=1 Tax=Sansalvadorimonas verongulae TaxID=2172824 RepID=UPI0012BBCA66|nr:SPOR domain-containing protein [Sansalvadorimonas verongulae]MTI11875.1 SPOR domain-containing protein [Sansalvadorimonas verongulae]
MKMRYLFVALLICNIGYFGYQLLTSEKPDSSIARVVTPQMKGETIKLLSEAITEGSAKRVERVVVGDDSVRMQTALCTQIGAFRARDTAAQVHQRLMAASIGSEIRQFKVPTAPDYWVYIPPLSNRSAALRKLKELQAHKVDSFIVTEGELTNGISLGLFTREDLAIQLRDRHLANGYNVKMKEMDRYRFEYWVEIRKEDRELLSHALWSSIHERYGFAEKSDNLCDSGVASQE